MTSGDFEGKNQIDNGALDRLLARYRAACPDPEPGPSFMPGLWQRIEARRGIVTKLRIYAKNLATVAATACALMVALHFVPSQDRSGDEAISYVEALGRDAESEVVAFASFGAPEPAEIPAGGR